MSIKTSLPKRLLENGFNYKEEPLTEYDVFLNFFRRNKKKPEVFTNWLIKRIGNKLYEVYIDTKFIYLKIDRTLILSIDSKLINADEFILNIPNIKRDFNVEDFNYWFNNVYEGYSGTRGCPGIFLRLDKLSTGIIDDYCKHIDLDLGDKYEMQLCDYEKLIRTYWLERRDN